MSKNNFFMKFAQFYVNNIKNLKSSFDKIWDALVDHIFQGLIIIISNAIVIIGRIIYCILPIKQIHNAFIAVYVIVRDKNGLRDETGYYRKKDIEELKRAIAENTDEERG
jgi:hypothetical protein